MLTAVGLLLAGCMAAGQPRALNDHPLTCVASLDVDGVFAADPAGERVARAQRGLVLGPVDGGRSRRLAAVSPVALAWHPEGSTFAAAFATGAYATRVAVYAADGTLQRSIDLPVALDRLLWSRRGDLLAVGHALKVFSFGGNLRQILYIVNEDEPGEVLLSDTTLKPATVKQLAGHLDQLLSVAFSGFGDELVHVRLHDPPEFAAYLQLVHSHWQVAGQRLLRRLPVRPVTLAWVAGETAVSVTDASGAGVTIPLWGADEGHPSAQPVPDPLPGRGQLQTFADGSYLLAGRGWLCRGSGLDSQEPPAYDEKDWMMRRWRFEGLITAEEYLEFRQGGGP